MVILVITLMIAIFTVSALVIGKLLISLFNNTGHKTEAVTVTLSNGTVVSKQYLTPNRYSRPQTKLKKVNGIVIHYTANPGTSASANRNYFEGLARKKTTSASSHYIIGLEGEIIQCIPLTEIAYASNERNKDTISIECCHPDETGRFNEETYKSLVALAAVLYKEFNLGEEDIIRHYDVSGKLCPLYYVENETEWEKLKKDIMDEIIKMNEDKQNNI
ncbi:N-acetylmuramoyl-L-alanine amidase [Mobilitalea sibirica]|uniref:N-acetylmuramoyl-L-alanine amidase n=2 Tax=Mobilitalea sibirica TaxID=1462919 RepID=A0A8J7HA01_9FIRM|nr:peptidoglycan recognition family protein [Mobilitalea sibirica]MBH1939446.1 N-acetylmuramoyl-L-alanine amidase [Mobilitalea sibirica]